MRQVDLLRKLMDLFAKNENSNIGKIMQIISEQFNTLEEEITRIGDWRDIDQAQGTTLDLIGAARGQQRGQATDELMRILIKARIARNNSDGTLNDVITALALTLNIPVSEVEVKSLWEYGAYNLLPTFNSGEWTLDTQSLVISDYRLDLDDEAVSQWSDLTEMKWSDL